MRHETERNCSKMVIAMESNHGFPLILYTSSQITQILRCLQYLIATMANEQLQARGKSTVMVETD